MCNKIWLKTVGTEKDTIKENYKRIQLSSEGEVNSGGYIVPRRSSPTLRGIVVLVFTKSDGYENAAS